MRSVHGRLESRSWVLSRNPAQTPKDLLIKVALFSCFLVLAYPISFFSRTDVRAMFKDKGVLVI